MTLRVSARALTPNFRRMAYWQTRTVKPRQFSSGSHSASKSSDTPWIIGSALVFIPTIIHLLSPSARSKPHQVHGAVGHDQPHAPAEPAKSEETVADAEGTEVPVEEVKASIVQAMTQDSPKEAAQAEVESAESTKYDNDAPGQKAETDREQIERPQAEPEKHTVQDDKPRPMDLGQAREETTQASAPKQVVDRKDSE